jgi:hypothetical protein
MGAWVMPDAVAVMLGDHGGSAMLQLAEDGTYWVGETLIESGGMVTGENGHYYTLTMDDEGMWMGAWVMPDAVAVMLGDHGGSDRDAAAMLQLAEDGNGRGRLVFDRRDGDRERRRTNAHSRERQRGSARR